MLSCVWKVSVGVASARSKSGGDECAAKLLITAQPGVQGVDYLWPGCGPGHDLLIHPGGPFTVVLHKDHKQKTQIKRHSCRLMKTAAVAVAVSWTCSPSAGPSRPWPLAPGRERRRTLGRWRRGPAPRPPSPWWRSSPATPTRWRTTRRCRTRAGSGAGWAARGADTAAGPGGAPRPGRPGTACRGCGPAAHRKPREAARGKTQQVIMGGRGVAGCNVTYHH